jgi:hypothetical protein
MQHKNYGLLKEDQVAALFKSWGYHVAYVPGSLGPYDITADKGGDHINVQVKATRTSTVVLRDFDDAFEHIKAALPLADAVLLIRSSKMNRRRPFVALVNGRNVWIWHLTMTVYDDGRENINYTEYWEGLVPSQPLQR